MSRIITPTVSAYGHIVTEILEILCDEEDGGYIFAAGYMVNHRSGTNFTTSRSGRRCNVIGHHVGIDTIILNLGEYADYEPGTGGAKDTAKYYEYPFSDIYRLAVDVQVWLERGVLPGEMEEAPSIKQNDDACSMFRGMFDREMSGYTDERVKRFLDKLNQDPNYADFIKLESHQQAVAKIDKRGCDVGTVMGMVSYVLVHALARGFVTHEQAREITGNKL